MRVGVLALSLCAVLVASCASVGVVKLSQNTARVVVHGPAIHDATNVQEIAYRQSAITTIQCGFDLFIVESADASGRHAGDWGSMPVDALIIEMYRADEATADALDAREVLGEDWEAIVQRYRKRIAGC